MEHIAEAQTVTRNLICISRADAFTCSTDLLSAFRLFIGGVKQTVSRSNQMDFLGNFKNRTEIHPTLFQLFGLLLEQHRIKHDTIADDIYLTMLKNA